ncbi:disintegrin and metalloproteinase domain-containing protein 2-like [Elephas maximus indicus]|uniref:disintegrin and metalloproteinase domain-containing protein 2-like n=1 Tax=Elephas maximus indicus TaxID=99487 RepID=UPI00211674E1|nr:disintegrin and metalloproteinase domain-containing protein 2-like [Elephas maximus indicus]
MGKEEINLLLFTNAMIVYGDSPKEYTKYLLETTWDLESSWHTKSITQSGITRVDAKTAHIQQSTPPTLSAHLPVTVACVCRVRSHTVFPRDQLLPGLANCHYSGGNPGGQTMLSLLLLLLIGLSGLQTDHCKLEKPSPVLRGHVSCQRASPSPPNHAPSPTKIHLGMGKGAEEARHDLGKMGPPWTLVKASKLEFQTLLCLSNCDPEKLRVQITVPEKIRSKISEGVESQVSYNIVIEGKKYTLNLTQKDFLPQDFRVYGYNGTGSMKPLEPNFQNLCNYQGFIEGFPNSVVIVSTCTGLRGLLQFENVSYGIEPLESSIGFEHVIYQVKHKNAGVSLYAEKEIDSRDMPYKIQSIEPVSDFSRFIEMHVVVEKKLYDHMGSDTAIVTEKIFQLIGLINAIFTSFNVTVILSSLELWIDENKISTAGDANELLHRFLTWKRSYLVLRPHDVAFLLVYRENSDYVGATFQGKMCDSKYGGGVALHPKTISLESLAVIIVQLLSLSMGIPYDDSSRCQCSGAVCIMSPEAILTSGMKIFSNCSMEDFARFMSEPKSQCLQNQPHLGPSYKVAVCGNGEVEQGEQCDCGSAEDCAAQSAPCCSSGTCTLTPGSQCAHGECCHNCNFKVKGEVCRSAMDECDLNEYCNGSSAACQEDLFIQNGHPCGGNQWICLDGKCMDGMKQCSSIFGEGTGFGSQECYTEINSRADRSGNCGLTPGGYTACKSKDLQCGKLICDYKRDTIFKTREAIALYSNVRGRTCVTLEYSNDHPKSQLMWVKEGTICGQNKVCKNKECVDSTYLNYDCTPEKCNSQGVCNNKKNCHCNPTYLPPNCQYAHESWIGGSVDSGNFPPTIPGLTDRSYIEFDYHAKPTKWPFFLLIPFFIVLCVLIAALVKVNIQRKKWRSEDYTSDEQLESDSEPKETTENP